MHELAEICNCMLGCVRDVTVSAMQYARSIGIPFQNKEADKLTNQRGTGPRMKPSTATQMEEFRRLEREAREARRGLWKKHP
jgi:endonuclease YncB( thermonuclease family)